MNSQEDEQEVRRLRRLATRLGDVPAAWDMAVRAAALELALWNSASAATS